MLETIEDDHTDHLHNNSFSSPSLQALRNVINR